MRADPKEHCKDCEDYKDRVKIAEQINEIFGTDGYWTFESCYKSCIKKSQKDEDYQRIKAKQYYHKNHPLAIYR